MADAADPLVLDFVEWIAREPRLYSEVIETWRTSCPRLTIWEDAVDRGLSRARPSRVGAARDGHRGRREIPARPRPRRLTGCPAFTAENFLPAASNLYSCRSHQGPEDGVSNRDSNIREHQRHAARSRR